MNGGEKGTKREAALYYCNSTPVASGTGVGKGDLEKIKRFRQRVTWHGCIGGWEDRGEKKTKKRKRGGPAGRSVASYL